MSKKRIAVVGAGASGLMSAICAARRCAELGKQVDIILFEKNPRPGKKLLATGNGRCNLTNTDETRAAYHTGAPSAAAAVLNAFPVQAILHFFAQIGLETVQNGTLVYPRSMQAASVLDVLRFEAARRGVTIQPEREVTDIRRTGKGFQLSSKGGNTYAADAVILAAGSAAGGGSDSGIALLKRLGHTVVPPYPALTPLKCDTTYIKTAAGMRANAQIRLDIDGAPGRNEYGEVLFSDYGLSGIAVMQLSGEASRLFASGGRHDIYIVLDLAPEYDFTALYALLQRRRTIFAEQPLEQLLCGFLNKRVAMAAIKAANIGPLSAAVSALTDKQLKTLTALLKAWRIPVTGVKGAPSAQVMGGGAALDEFDPHTLQSARLRGLFACGETLDIYGDCGGYNLTWAWTSGYVAGHGAADMV